MVAALKSNGIYESTLIIITAKHGQSPIDSARYLGISNSTGDPITTSPATILDGAGCLPTSESPSNPTGIGPTEDDVSLIWLNSSCTTASAVSMLRSSLSDHEQRGGYRRDLLRADPHNLLQRPRTIRRMATRALRISSLRPISA